MNFNFNHILPTEIYLDFPLVEFFNKNTIFIKHFISRSSFLTPISVLLGIFIN